MRARRSDESAHPDRMKIEELDHRRARRSKRARIRRMQIEELDHKQTSALEESAHPEDAD